MDAETRTSWRRRAGGAAALILALLAAWFLVRPALQAPAPRAEDWAAAAALIREDLSAGDLIRVEPFWSTGGRIWFGDLDGDEAKAFRLLDVHEPADPVWLTRAPRIWVVAAMGYGDDLVGDLSDLGYSARVDEDLGRVRVLRMDRGDRALRWELVENLHMAEIRGIDRGRVRRQVRRVAGGPRDCVIMGDLSAEGTSTVTLSWESIDAAGTLWIRAGNTMDSARKRVAGDISVTARAGRGETSLVVHEGSYSLETLRLPFEGGPLEIEVAGDDDHDVHQVCLDGLLVGPVPMPLSAP